MRLGSHPGKIKTTLPPVAAAFHPVLNPRAATRPEIFRIRPPTSPPKSKSSANSAHSHSRASSPPTAALPTLRRYTRTILRQPPPEFSRKWANSECAFRVLPGRFLKRPVSTGGG